MVPVCPPGGAVAQSVVHRLLKLGKERHLVLQPLAGFMGLSLTPAPATYTPGPSAPLLTQCNPHKMHS